MELLSHFNITPGQLMPNSWRIVISFEEIWLAVIEGDMIRVDRFMYLYRLKESKEYRYYKQVPWVRVARIVTNLPLSFRYWKSMFFFVSGDDWETPSDELWGDVPRLFRCWRALSLGASSFCKSFPPLYSFFFFCFFFLSLLTFLFVVSA